jgi:hypothetical protein
MKCCKYGQCLIKRISAESIASFFKKTFIYAMLIIKNFKFKYFFYLDLCKTFGEVLVETLFGAKCQGKCV